MAGKAKAPVKKAVKAPVKKAAKTAKPVVPKKTATAKKVATKKVAVKKTAAKPVAKPTAKVAAKTSAKPVTKAAANKVTAKPVEKAVAKTATPLKAVVSKGEAKPVAKTVSATAPQARATARPVERATTRSTNATSIVTAAVPPLPAPRPVANKPLPVTSQKDVTAAHEYLLSRSASRSEDPVIVNGKKLLSEEQLLKMPEAEYMNEEQLAFFKYRLQQMERELLANAGETTEHLRETVIVPDPADRATIEEEHALELRTRDRERKLLKKVQQAIASIDGGDYGFCEETGEPIGIPRLLARPTATLCLEAQQRREMKQKMFGD